MSSASSARPTIASMPAASSAGVPGGRSKPSVVSEEIEPTKTLPAPSWSIAQTTPAKPAQTRPSQVVTRASR